VFIDKYKVEFYGICLGLFAVVAQIVLLRETLSVNGGNELSLGVGFTCWLLGIAFGAAIAGIVPNPKSWTILVSTAIGPVFALELFVLRFHRRVFFIEISHLLQLGFYLQVRLEV